MKKEPSLGVSLERELQAVLLPPAMTRSLGGSARGRVALASRENMGNLDFGFRVLGSRVGLLGYIPT